MAAPRPAANRAPAAAVETDCGPQAYGGTLRSRPRGPEAPRDVAAQRGRWPQPAGGNVGGWVGKPG